MDKKACIGAQNAIDFIAALARFYYSAAIFNDNQSSAKSFIYLPIDAKFPLEDYQRLVVAQEKPWAVAP